MRRLPIVAMAVAVVASAGLTALPASAHDGNTWFPKKWNVSEVGSNTKWGLMPDWFTNSAYQARIQDGADSWTYLAGNRDLNQRNDWGANWNYVSCSDNQEQNGLRKVTIDGSPSSNDILAQTYRCPDRDGHLWSANIGFDEAEPWYTGFGSPGGSEYDLWSSATHEFGHLLGFAGHWNQPDPAPALCGGSEPREFMCSNVTTGVVRSYPQEHDRHTFNDAY